MPRREAVGRDRHLQGSRDPHKAVGEGGNQYSIPRVAHGFVRDSVDQPPPLVFQDGGPARPYDVLGIADGKVGRTLLDRKATALEEVAMPRALECVARPAA